MVELRVGVFFHEELRGRDWPIIGNKFAGFPEAMKEAVKLPNVRLYKPKPVSEELLLKVHSPSLLERVKDAWYYHGARLSVGGCVEAAERIMRGEIDAALVFNVAAGHHAGPDSAWGGTYLSCTGPAIVNLREKFGPGRFAILDTDRHHGDGCRAIFMGDRDVLHVCFCDRSLVEDGGTKVDVDVGWSTTDGAYLELVMREFVPRVEEFKPKLIFHFLGHDTCQGDYGDLGLTMQFFPRLVQLVKTCAERVCQGRYLIITGGGYRRDVAEYIFPRIIEILAG